MPAIFQPILGLSVFLTLCFLFSENKSQARLVSVGKSLILQFFLALCILKFPPVKGFFHWVGTGVSALRDATLQGTQFVFGYLGGGTNTPFDISAPQNLFVFALQALPLVIVFSAIAMLLFHWNILPLIVRGLSWFFKKTLDMGGALGVCSGAKIILGQTEAPLLIRPYLSKMSRGELFTVMTLGLATTSGTILAIYAAILEHTVPDVMTHVITASVINIPAAIAISRLLIPHGVATEGDAIKPYEFNSSMDAISKGTSDGLQMFLNIIAMLIVFIALVSLANKILGFIPSWDNHPITLQRLLGYIMAPVTWLMGIPWTETLTTGSLLGIKTILNEMFAFTELAGVDQGALPPTSRIIMTYALCGFANVSSIGILIAGIGGIAPDRRQDIIALGGKALVAGTLASCFSGTIVGLILTLFN